jgi:hypothetical protein
MARIGGSSALVRDHARARAGHVTALGAPTAISLDETASWRPPTQTVADDVRHPVVNLDTVRHHRRAPPLQDAVSARLEPKPQVCRGGIERVVIELHQPYASAMRPWLRSSWTTSS